MITPMPQAAITVYGIPNCDTVRCARAWLGAHLIEYRFHDFKKLGVPAQRIDRWIALLGWEKLLNRQGNIWRKLDAAARATVTDATGARSLMLAQPSVIKRPVVEWSGDEVTTGFDATAWQARIG